MRITLNTPTNSRKTMGRIINAFHKNEMTEDNFRALIYGLSRYLEYWKFEKELDLEKRLEAIEEVLRNEKR